MTTTTTTATAAAGPAAMNVGVPQLCGGAGGGGGGRGRRRRPTDLRWARLLRLAVATRVVRLVWDQLLACSSCGGGGGRYRRLGPPPHGGDVMCPVPIEDDDGGGAGADPDAGEVEDVVGLKVSLLGDCQIGKTSFMVKYVGDDGEEQNGLQMTGLNLMDKTLAVRGARLAFNIWDVAGDSQSIDHVPIACKDAVAILFMFDLTSRCTLNNTIDWHERARKWNKTAIPILIGTKFDDFAQLPLEMQWTIVNEFQERKLCPSSSASAPGHRT
ncbi:septum-promoting GTP-binding protein 1 isoform X2 [Brachypodium distachyon]|uniref:septum-promoting GTP-binding protein 1 isoform X2 n=1 Tax=Brachypodium distachyon TaxID=15368 RepID=UPI000D0C9ABC|nr:septum-promoting GTP-binding protein 1 isoform X2 [Brachypodium distachyon]|eukprot:XP_024313706.1 septum-promoting GTP-binding protein 1 isoform X2 [Brachypodium distachyon]